MDFNLFFELINTVLLDKNLIIAFILILCVLFFMGINIILGTLCGSVETRFDFKKFIFGILKALAIGLTIFAFSFGLDVFVIAINMLPAISISTELVTVLEIVAIIVAIGIDITKEIVEKIKSLRELKFIKYEDVHYNDGNGASK